MLLLMFVGATVLHKASEQGLVDIVKLLLAKGASPNHPDGDGYTALHVSIEITNIISFHIISDWHAGTNISFRTNIMDSMI